MAKYNEFKYGQNQYGKGIRLFANKIIKYSLRILWGEKPSPGAGTWTERTSPGAGTWTERNIPT